MMASNTAIENGNYNDYIAITKVYEKAIFKLSSNNNDNNDDMNTYIIDAHCTQTGHSGVIYYYIYSNMVSNTNSLKLTKYSKKNVHNNVREKVSLSPLLLLLLLLLFLFFFLLLLLLLLLSLPSLLLLLILS